MGKLSLIDCTLRDGGNLNDWAFTPEDLDFLVTRLSKSGVDYVEVGYRGGSGSNTSTRTGPAARCSAAYLDGLNIPRERMAVMVVPTVCPLDLLDDLWERPIGLLRVAAYPRDVPQALSYVTCSNRRGVRVSLNVMSASYVTPDELSALARSAHQAGADVFYMADSFGALHPDSVRARVEAVRSVVDLPVGFHGHNNLGLAFANALAAIGSGASYVDGSLAGMARGAGNLPLEQFVAAADVWPALGGRYAVGPVLEAADYVLAKLTDGGIAITSRELLAGIYDLHYYFLPLVDEQVRQTGLERAAVLRALSLMRPPKVSAAAVAEACRVAAAEARGEGAPVRATGRP